jgi:hypothetical protein
MDGTIPQEGEEAYHYYMNIDPVDVRIKSPVIPYKTIQEEVYSEYMQRQMIGVEYIRSCEFLMNSFERASKKMKRKTLLIYPDKEDPYHFGDYECSAELIREMGKNNLGLYIERYKSPDGDEGRIDYLIEKLIFENRGKSPQELLEALSSLEEDALKMEDDSSKKLEIAKIFAEAKMSFLSTEKNTKDVT